MASSGKTPNIQLNQWADTDPIMRLDFNADNQKLDAALNAVPYRTLADVTTTAPLSRIDVNIGRPFSDFQEIEFVISGLKHNYNDVTLYDYDILLQNLTNLYYNYNVSDTNSLFRLQCPPQALQHSFTRVKLEVISQTPNTKAVIYAECVTVYSTLSTGTSVYTRTERQTLYVHDPSITSPPTSVTLPLESISTINVISRSSNCIFQPGARVRVWGLLKQ